MRISKITVENFRSIERVELAANRFNVLAGQNNHGKTNLFEAIEWFYNGSGNLDDIRFKHQAVREVTVEIEYSDIQAGIAAVINEATKARFEKFADGRDVIKVRRTTAEDPSKRQLWDEAKGEWTQKNFAGFDKAFNDCVPRLQYVSTRTSLTEVSKWGKKTPIGEMLSGVLNAILEKSEKYRQFKEKFDELFTHEQSEVRQELDRLAGKVKDHLEQQFPECSKVGFSVKPPMFDELLKSFETSVDDGIETSAEEKGDGMQRALMLAILKAYSDHRRESDELGKRFLFLIDEAELHLHPTAQRQLKLALMDLVKNGDQVFINTHSSVLVTDEDNDQTLWRVEKVDGATSIKKIEGRDKPELIYELLGGSPADLLFPRNFLVVEGASEDILLGHVVRRFYIDKPQTKIIRAEGDHSRQKRSMDAINVAFVPLSQTPVYSERLIVLCDQPTPERKNDFDGFMRAYARHEQNGQFVVAPTHSLEESYPEPWRKTADQVRAMSGRDKTDLAELVGQNITQTQFENEMAHAFAALAKAWEKAHS
ncbi:MULTISPECIES: AAA family ATPase [unclassified Rhodanobacter]|uniref:ATP-dependent nuclease n=1 Tax=unclassified Rhodanobacter TaxID=2621553 RepID=UPI001BDFA4F2|nr:MULTISPECIES: AAA family ATPase [unclassified Rhodanobacter]MBT2144958.1 AAA family ATPase [Rhodanobacter sp. LX-99]MBT2149003.1 AAA family ATPase [Rhodanobacter sp. LX-100]